MWRMDEIEPLAFIAIVALMLVVAVVAGDEVGTSFHGAISGCPQPGKTR